MQACAEGDVQGVMQLLSTSASSWFMAHAPPLLAAHPRGAKVLTRQLPEQGGDQVAGPPGSMLLDAMKNKTYAYHLPCNPLGPYYTP